MILVGSKALVERNPEILKREWGLDTDYIAHEGEFKSLVSHLFPESKLEEFVDGAKRPKSVVKTPSIIECEYIVPGSTSEQLLQLVEKDKDTLRQGNTLIPSLDMLFTLKSSHKYLKNSPHFWKTATDYHNMKAAGAVIRPEFKDFHKARSKETYWYNHPSLKQSKADFFADDGIKYAWDHDDVHKAIAIYEHPAYTYYIKDGAEVDCDKEKFFSQPIQIRLAGVIEEAAVLAIERSLVPHPGIKTPKEAWFFALAKVCSSITSGWFRAFAYEHLPVITKLYPEGYWERFQQAIKEGKVKEFDNATKPY